MSYDHRAEDALEQKRIADSGGFVARNRVLGILAVTRSFGDHGMKDFVIAEPHITDTAIPTTVNSTSNTQTSDAHPLLILACDGVWDVMTDQEAVDFVLSKCTSEGVGESRTFLPERDAAKLLVQEALDRGSTDNVTAIVVFL